MAKALLVLGTLLVLAGCGGGHVRAAVTPTPSGIPTPTPPPADGGTFASPDLIINKAWSTLPCGETETEAPTNARAQVSCDDHKVVARTYADHRGVDEEVQRLGCMRRPWLLTGVNWTLEAPEETLVAAHRRLGGDVVHARCTRSV